MICTNCGTEIESGDRHHLTTTGPIHDRCEVSDESLLRWTGEEMLVDDVRILTSEAARESLPDWMGEAARHRQLRPGVVGAVQFMRDGSARFVQRESDC